MKQFLQRCQRPASLLCLTAVVAACSSSNGKDEPKAAAERAEQASLDDRDTWAQERNLTVSKFDLNRDGEPDVYKFAKKVDGVEVIIRKDLDLNNDSKIDVIRLYDDQGGIISERTDLDFDGKFDVLALYDDEELKTKELDIDFDGVADVFRHYVSGKLERVESDANGDGKIDTWEYYAEGQLDRVGTDNDGDGVVDHWDRRGRKEPAPPSDSTSTSEEEASSGSETDNADEGA